MECLCRVTKEIFRKWLMIIKKNKKVYDSCLYYVLKRKQKSEIGMGSKGDRTGRGRSG